MRFAVLGPLVVTAPEPVRLERRAHQRLLAILLLERDRPLDTDALIDRLWGEEAPPTARAALQTYVSQLRRHLGPDIIVTRSGAYVLDLTGHELDVSEFDALAERARGALADGAWHQAAEAAAQALRLWRGGAYPALGGSAFAAGEIARLEELWATLVELRAEALLALGRNEEAVPELVQFLRGEPYRERAWAQLMVARARLGRTVEALEGYHEARRALREAGLDPGPTLRELEARILREDPALVAPQIRNNLPSRRTSFLGREPELAELRRLLGIHRLVTLTGAGGSGKTRLAVEAADAALGGFPDGVWLVDLATVSDPELVKIQASVVLGLRAEEASLDDALTLSLRFRKLLVLLDNCEHVLEASAGTAETLLSTGSGVTVLATSRAPLGLVGEVVLPVDPLPVPASDAAAASEIAGFASIRLLCERAALVAPGFAPSDANAAALTSICRNLDGLPLAIELAASRMSALAPEDIANRLGSRFHLLARTEPVAPARHRTLEAAIAWSYDHLGDAQRQLLCRLAVFAGAFSLETAEDVCSGHGLAADTVAALLAELVDRSLLVAMESAAGRRYRLLETIRQYAHDRLRLAPDAQDVRRRHRDHFLRLAQGRLGTPDPELAWLESMRDARDDVALALTWSHEAGDAFEAAILAAALGAYWIRLHHPRQAVAVLRETLNRADLREHPERGADLRWVLADGLFALGDSEATFTEAAEAVRLVSARPATIEKLLALETYASLYPMLITLDPLGGVLPAQEALTVAHELGDDRALHSAHNMLGFVLAWSGSIDAGREHKERALAIAERLGGPELVLLSYAGLFTPLYLHPERRRTEPGLLADEILARFGSDPSLDALMPWGWMGYSFLLAGQWERAATVIERMARQEREGFDLTHVRHLRGCLCWMQGRLDEAAEEMAAAVVPGLSPRWYHDVFDLQADVAADRGDVEQVRAIAARYQATDVHRAEEALKSAVMRSLIRAEVQAACDSTGPSRADHARRARAALRAMQDLVARFPPPTGGSIQLETAATNLAVGKAEVARLTTPRPELWADVATQASYAYWRLYASWRRADALFATDRAGEAVPALRHAHEGAKSLGAALMQRRLEALAASRGVPLDLPSVVTSG